MMKKPLTKEVALDRLRGVCARAELSTADARLRLSRWGVSASAANAIITSLVRERFIDDDRYCRAFVADRWRLSMWGRVKIRAALAERGLASSEAATQALDEIDPDAYRRNLAAILRPRIESLGREEASTYATRQKLLAAAVRRGYELPIAVEVLKSLLS